MSSRNFPKTTQLTNTKLLEPVQCENEASRLLHAYLDTFREAPEAGRLLKAAYFDYNYKKEYLQEHVLFIHRSDYLWFFKYFVGPGHERTIELKKRSTDKNEELVEIMTLQTRIHYTVEKTTLGDTIYTRTLGDGITMRVTNTTGAVALAEKLLADFKNDRVIH
jgi:hypothetical protein